MEGNEHMRITPKIGALLAAVTLGAVASTGCHSTGSRYERSTGQYVDDKAMVRNVEEALENDPVYKLDEVRVTSYRGTVQLSGFVTSEEQLERAGEIAADVPGVQTVDNNVSIKPAPLRQRESTRQEQEQEQESNRPTDQAPDN
jgi:hypothetical protein